MRIFLILLITFLSACGDSPFLKEDESPTPDSGIFGLRQEALSFSKVDYHIKAYWRQEPVLFEANQLLVLILDGDEHPADLKEELRLKLWMPGMGHGSFPISVKKTALGIYEASEIFFTMGGYWDLHFELYRDEKLYDEVKWGMTF